jgi:hypothetical protein
MSTVQFWVENNALKPLRNNPLPFAQSKKKNPKFIHLSLVERAWRPILDLPFSLEQMFPEQ